VAAPRPDIVAAVLLVTHQEAMERFDYGDLIDFFEAQHQRPRAIVVDSFAESTDGNGLLARTGFVPGEGLGVKLASVFPGNVGRPAVHSVYVLFDHETGEERAILVGNALTWFKTACDSALGSRRLARPDSTRLLMVGAGAMAPHLIRAHLEACPSIDEVTIWNRHVSRAREVAEELTDVEPVVAEDLAAAVRDADIISCATMSVDPLVLGRWVRPGTHVDLVGAYKPDMREADDALLQKALVFVDSREGTLTQIGELAIPISTGAITAADVLGDLFELTTGAVGGRTSPDEITVFKNGGGGHLDLMAAQYLIGRIDG
jgi:ornithine cyclodeaminase